ncbi:MAG: polysaccharide biosynthesis/export family protein [Candidatus Omnitrophica bacterium]|nr:polysaccharide biosynthesis/export family protein [Candidatus Omnitrophota bacterium]
MRILRKRKLIGCVLAVVGLFFFAVAGVNAATVLDKSNRHYQKGLEFYEKGKFKAAEAEFKKAILASSQAKENYYNNGLKLYDQGKYEEARAEFQKAIEATKQENDQHYKRGLILYNQGRYKEAEQEFQKAISTIKDDKKVERFVASKTDQGRKTLEYIIGNGDVLFIKVWQNSDLDDEVIVRPDGRISFTLVGDVIATGMTISEFRQDLTSKLKEFIRSPQVSVSIKAIGGKKVIILGQVKSPGVYQLTGAKTILEAVSLAGGFTEHAVVSSVMLIEGGFEKPEPKRLNLVKALERADISDNVALKTDDMIYVPRKFIKDVNYFLQQFLDPVSRGLFIRRELRDF